MSGQTAIFFPSDTYFTSQRQLGDEYDFIAQLYGSYPGQALFVYSSGALENAFHSGLYIIYLDTGFGDGKIREFMNGRIAPILASESAEIHQFGDFLQMSSFTCLEVMQNIYSSRNLPWNQNWHLWQSAYWNLLSLIGVVRGRSLGVHRPS